MTNQLPARYFLNITNLIKKILVAATVVLIFTSCSSTKKMDRLLARHYGDAPANPFRKKSDYIAVSSKLTSADLKPSQTEKGKRKLLPLIVYWHSDYSNIATLNANIPLANVDASLLSYANQKGLREKLNGKKIEFFVDSIPHRFEIEDKGWMVFLLICHFGSDLITINPDTQNMIVPYKIWQDNNVVKTGQITVINHDRIIKKKFLQFSNKWIHDYLDGYDERIKSMTKELIDQLLLEI